jgi:ribosome-binding factor A
MGHRVDKVAAQLHEEISDILSRRVHDPRLALLNVVEVTLTPDLRTARVHVSTLAAEPERKAIMEALEHARGFVRRELAERLRSNLRRVPEIVFVDDRNIEYAIHIGQVLKEILPNES